MGERLIQHEEKLSVVVLRPMPECYFFILHNCSGALTGLKHFWLTDNSFWLFFSDSKCYTHDQQCCIFQKVMNGKYSTVIYLMFTHANAINVTIE